MTSVRRLKVVGAALALAAIVTNQHIWGEAADQAPSRRPTAQRFNPPDQSDENLAEDLANSKFAKENVLSYRTTEGDVLFALQLKPKLEPTAVRPRDYLVMIDTSASQVRGPLTLARDITKALITGANPGDRVSIWTVNIPAATACLTRGFQEPLAEPVQQALDKLKDEVPLGDTDLKEGLRKAVATFSQNPDRQQVVLFLGDGMSIHNPITPAERAQLCEEMTKSGVAFYSVPLGPRLDPANLHGLATGTGGAVVRMSARDKVPDALKNLNQALATPILYPKSFQVGAEVSEFYPTILPPLRGDAPTLVVGKIKGQTLSYILAGSVAGREVRLQNSENLGDAEPDNFFLVGMIEQWKKGKDQPALTRADRALAYAHEQSQLARADLITQAEWALGQEKLEVAQNLFEQAKKLDPKDVEADAGLKVVEKLRSGLLKKQQLKDMLAKQDKNGLQGLAQAGDKAPPPKELAPPVPEEDLIQEMKQRTAIEEQRVTQTVDEARREARQLLTSDPDAAHDLLKAIYAGVRENRDLSERVRQILLDRLEGSLRSVDLQGARIKAERKEQQQLRAQAVERMGRTEANAVEEERTRARMLAISNLFAHARYEDAYLESQALRQDAINSGRGVPVAATMAYQVALSTNNLSQFQELERVRQERFLLTLMQVERSHVPFPDEPPIQFPPAPVWREITRLRKEKYENSGFTEDDPATLQKVRALRDKMSRPINLERGIDAQTPLKDALEFLSDRYELTILVDSQAFKAEGTDAVEDQPVKLPKMIGVSLGTVLRLLTAQVNGTFLIRRDYIEVTTGARAVVEKVVRVYPVADLVIPIPNDFNRRAVSQQLSILGTAPGLGLQLGSPQALGGLGALGAFGLGGLGLLGLGGGLGLLGLGGGLGGLGLAGGALGLGGGLGGGGGAALGGGAPQNLGVGGGSLGFGGGQLGQLGNLGGQFGLQGGDQSQVLLRLIQDVVGTPREWQRLSLFNRPQGQGNVFNPGGQQAGGARDQEVEEDLLEAEKLNSLGYYPPARALVVKGTSRIHTNLGGGLLTGRGGPGGMGALDRRPDGAIVIAPHKKDDPLRKPNERLASAAEKKNDKVAAKDKEPQNAPDKKSPEALAARDPRKIWQDALVKGVEDPGMIIAVADYMFQFGKYDHLAEFLKANLRQGIMVRPWVYEALALALEASGGSPDEIERARVSAVDLEPLDAQGFVRASKAMADLKRYDRAVAFCRHAALLEPNAPAPFEETLRYAQLAKDPSAMEWAAGTLLRQDWPADNDDLHHKASSRLKELAQLLQREKRQAEAERMVASVNRLSERDLVVKAKWQGDADIDLAVKEPIGTDCSFQQRQTPGGGILLGENLSDLSSETYVAAKAFPGDYQVTLRRIWGRPQGGKVNLEIIQHQGTPRETRRLETVVFDRYYSLTLHLEDGRRTAAEYVPPPAAKDRSQPKTELVSASDGVLTKLRMLADPELTGTAEPSMRGKLDSLGIPAAPRTMPKPDRVASDLVLYQTRVKPLVGSGSDLTAQASVAPDQSSITLKLSPIFQTVGKSPPMPTIANPLIPGATDPLGGR
jgi:hypothetical protein